MKSWESFHSCSPQIALMSQKVPSQARKSRRVCPQMRKDKAVKPLTLGEGWRGTLALCVGPLGAGVRGVGRAGRVWGLRCREGNAQPRKLIAKAGAGYSPVNAYFLDM